MGSLAVAGESATPAPADDRQQDPAPAPEDQRATDDQGGDDDGGEATRPLSRREEATRRAVADEMARHQRAYDDRLQQAQTRWQQDMLRMQQENAQLQARLAEAAQQRAQPAPTPREDPDEVQRQANKKLDEKDFDEYQRLTNKALELRVERRLEAARASWQEEANRNRPPPPMDPLVAMNMAKFEHVAMAGQRGEALVMNKAQALELNGWQRSPALLAKAFELANEDLKAASQSQAAAVPRFDSSSAAALGGVPAARQPSVGAGGGGDGGGQAPKLTPLEEDVRRRAKMSVEEYVMWKTDPEKAAARRKKTA